MHVYQVDSILRNGLMGRDNPVNKSNDSSDPSNYRGVSITSAIGKVFNTVLKVIIG